MKAAKRSGWGARLAGPLGPLLAPFVGRSTVVAALALLGIGLSVWYLAWDKWGPMISRQDRYLLTADSLEITRPPLWLRRDIRAEVLRDGSLSKLSVLDPDVTRQVARAFELHTWVAGVRRVAKRPGRDAPRILVDVQYRQPVIMVKTRDGFWPIDTRGFLLPPNDFSPRQTREYLRVWAGDRQPAGPVGTPFGDASIVGAAQVAASLTGVWQDVGVEWIVVESVPRDAQRLTVQPTYVLLPTGTVAAAAASRSEVTVASTRSAASDGVEVRWGHAPGQELPGEAIGSEKAMRLVQFVEEHGRLDKLPQAAIIDLRPRLGVTITPRKTPLLPASY